MFVIADIEWVEYETGECFPTQLAAISTDSRWKELNCFFARVRPEADRSPDWKHIAYKGGSPEDFMDADDVQKVLSDFLEWLNDDDIILWWTADPEEKFRSFIGDKLDISDVPRTLVIKKEVCAFLSAKGVSMYKLARGYGVNLRKYTAHCSRDDVGIISEFLSRVNFPQKLLTTAAEKTESDGVKYYLADNTVHSANCDKFDKKSAEGFVSLSPQVIRESSFCECCRAECKEQSRRINSEHIKKMKYNFVYLEGSKVFHKCDCRLVLSSKEICGAQEYDAVSAGRAPCKVCRPSPSDEVKIVPAQEDPIFASKSNKKEDERALKRLKEARRERTERLKNKSLTEAEIKDVYTLTQPTLAFWASKGYSNFHLRNCPRLKQLSNLTGFSAYEEAIKHGYTPCRKCRPTAKSDVTLSIPITNHSRKGEKLEHIKEMCDKEGYTYSSKDNYFIINTPVGKWRINRAVNPIKLDHINLVKTPGNEKYHRQPRAFLSLTDVFNYIKRHDEELMKKRRVLVIIPAAK